MSTTISKHRFLTVSVRPYIMPGLLYMRVTQQRPLRFLLVIYVVAPG